MARSPLLRKQYHERLELHRFASGDSTREFREAVARGLEAAPKAIPPKYFYDQRGSALFERITDTEEYYLTRTERWILGHHGTEIVAATGGGLTMVEFGSGSSAKTRILLDLLAPAQPELAYVPIDISPAIVRENGQKLLEDYPSLRIHALIGDYDQGLEALRRLVTGPKLLLFLGSSLGNFEPEAAVEFLRLVRSALAPGDHLLLGVDLVKPPEILNRAYNDAAGVTADFNLNLLARINRELGGRFALERFRHRAFFNGAESRIEMHLESREAQTVAIEALGREFSFAAGETIHTENSYKYNYLGLERMLRESGLRFRRVWHDPEQWFALSLIAPA